jgi:glycosyltransferase involved in cell wall biosynthesis
MKVAVYAVALNEEQFVKRWAESAKEADYLLIADTGSTDNTVQLARSLGIVCHIISVKPWRFDDARNASLSLIPSDIDYCIALDLDETLVPGWRQHLEVANTNNWTRPRYLFTTSWNPDGSPGMQFSGFRIHAREGYRWKYPIHELPEPYRTEETSGWIDLQIEHHPDDSKSRGQYLPLLKEAAQENPEDDRCSFYYARELYFHGLYSEAAAEFKRHLSLPKAWWKAQRANAYRYLGECEQENAEVWWSKGYEEDPIRRECAVKMSEYYYAQMNWKECKEWALRALAIETKSLDYFCEPWAWGSLPHDYLAIALYNLGEYENAVEHGKIAYSLDPTNERLAVNISHYTAKLQEH